MHSHPYLRPGIAFLENTSISEKYENGNIYNKNNCILGTYFHAQKIVYLKY
jgi:hypothetical protein